jgi:aminopeptidase N
MLKYSNVAAVTPDDLWVALQDPLNETNVTSAEHELKTVMNNWMYQENYPIVHVKRDYKNNIAIIQQQRFGERAENLEYQKAKWWIPISFTTQNNSAFSDTAPRVWLNPKNALNLFDLADEDHWVIVNLQQSG